MMNLNMIEIETVRRLTANGIPRDVAERRAGAIARGWRALAARPEPTAADFSGCTSEREARWCALGGRVADLHALEDGSPEQAEAVAVALETGKPVADAITAAPRTAETRRFQVAKAKTLVHDAGLVPDRPDFSGCTSSEETELVRAGLLLHEASRFLTGTDSEASAALDSVEVRCKAAARLRAAPTVPRPAWSTSFERR